MGPLKLIPMGFEQLSAANLAAAFALASIPVGANCAVFCAVGAAVMWRDDKQATSVSATSGIVLQDGVAYDYFGALSQLRFILKSGAPVLNVSYYKIGG